uniref:Uncharacterized protein n=1 Tax=Leptobrachium leishanense TaxID=445787 RepID=A0A8C5LW32_9ANUR
MLMPAIEYRGVVYAAVQDILLENERNLNVSFLSQSLKGIWNKMESKNVLDGKVAIVTGSTYGIGLAIARRFAQDGAHVVLSSRKQENVDKAVKQLKDEGLSVAGIVCHVGVGEHREKLITKALELHGKIDILICNAAVNPFVGPLLDTTEEMWEKVFRVNVISTFLMVKHAVPHMQKQGGGSVVICSSFVGYIPLPVSSVGPGLDSISFARTSSRINRNLDTVYFLENCDWRVFKLSFGVGGLHFKTLYQHAADKFKRVHRSLCNLKNNTTWLDQYLSPVIAAYEHQSKWLGPGIDQYQIQ